MGGRLTHTSSQNLFLTSKPNKKKDLNVIQAKYLEYLEGRLPTHRFPQKNESFLIFRPIQSQSPEETRIYDIIWTHGTQVDKNIKLRYCCFTLIHHEKYRKKKRLE